MTVIYYGKFEKYTRTEFPEIDVQLPMLPFPADIPAGLEGDELVTAQAAYYRQVDAYNARVAERTKAAEFFGRTLWIRNADGQDMYELRKTLPVGYKYVTTEDDNFIRVIHTDPHDVLPANGGHLYATDADIPTDMNVIFHRYFDPATGTILDLDKPRQVLSVSSAQAKVALFRTKKTADGTYTRDPNIAGTSILSMVQGLLPNYPADVQLWYDNARDWERYNTYVLGFAQELSITDAEMDELFAYAFTLST